MGNTNRAGFDGSAPVASTSSATGKKAQPPKRKPPGRNLVPEPVEGASAGSATGKKAQPPKRKPPGRRLVPELVEGTGSAAQSSFFLKNIYLYHK